MAKSVERKDYDYRCKKAPIASHCNKRMCRTCEFGVGETAEGGQRPEIHELKKIEAGDDSYYIATINDKRITFTLDELLNQQSFKRKVAHHINRVPRSIPGDRWDKFLDDLIRDCEIDYLPLDATPFGQFIGLVEMYLRSKGRTTDKKRFASSATDVPFIDGTGKVYFKMRGLMRFLDTNGFKHYKRESDVGMALKRDPINAEPHQLNIGKHNCRCWQVDLPDESDEDTSPPELGTQVF